MDPLQTWPRIHHRKHEVEEWPETLSDLRDVVQPREAEESMNPTPWKYRNVINPWQTPREIANAVTGLDRMMAKLNLTKEAEEQLLCQRIEWDWNKPT